MPKLFRSVALAAVAFVFSTALPAQAAEPFGSTACTGVRPGAWMEAPRRTVYTMGFLFKGTDANRKTANYITTVGAYVLPTFGIKKWAPRTGPQAYDATGKPIGRFVYAEHTETPEFSSFGLVELDKSVKANPQVCHFGGPTGLHSELDVTPRTIEYYGNGFPIDQVSPARTAVAIGTAGEQAVFALGAFMWSIDSGDDGAPVLADGNALGFYDGGAGGDTDGPSGAGFVVRRIGPAIVKIQRGLKLKLVLQTARRL